MPCRIVLKIVDGPLQGQQFVFDRRSVCVMGRAPECQLRLLVKPEEPSAAENRRISRHHCLLDIAPPQVRIRDLGSLNGTYVNGRNIGKRPKGAPPGGFFPEYDLTDGDEICLGRLKLRVSIEQDATDAMMASNRLGPIGGEVRDQPTIRPDARSVEDHRSTERRAAMRRTMIEPIVETDEGFAATAGGSGADEGDSHTGRRSPMELSFRSNSVGSVMRRRSESFPAVPGFEIIRELGRSSVGIVYLAQQRQTQSLAAIKVMTPKGPVTAQAAEDFLREVQRVQTIRHPNIARLWNFEYSENRFVFVMEYCDGGSVDGLLAARGGPLPIEEALKIIIQALEGLDYTHHLELTDSNARRPTTAKGLVHRGIKPQNILLSRADVGWRTKIGDYGLAKAFDMAGLNGHTYMGDFAEIPHFMPRQQLLRFHDVTPDIDVWSTAAVLYYMLTNCSPRFAGSDCDPWQAILEHSVVPIRQRNPVIPKRLAEVIDRALREEPRIGFASAAELKDALLDAMG